MKTQICIALLLFLASQCVLSRVALQKTKLLVNGFMQAYEEYKEQAQSVESTNLKNTEPVVFMDYVLRSFEGLQSDKFIPGSLNCAYNMRDTQLDFMHMIHFIGLKQGNEQTFFNISGTISKTLPDSVFNCYDIPIEFVEDWQKHIEEF